MKEKKPHIPSPEEAAQISASREAYMSLFQGARVRRSTILNGGEMLNHAINQLVAGGTVMGQEVFDFNPEGGVIFDTELWSPKHTNGLDKNGTKD